MLVRILIIKPSSLLVLAREPAMPVVAKQCVFKDQPRSEMLAQCFCNCTCTRTYMYSGLYDYPTYVRLSLSCTTNILQYGR